MHAKKFVKHWLQFTINKLDSELSISSGRSLSLALSLWLSLFILSLLSPQYPFNQALPAPPQSSPLSAVSDTFFHSVQQQVIFSFICPFLLPILFLSSLCNSSSSSVACDGLSLPQFSLDQFIQIQKRTKNYFFFVNVFVYIHFSSLSATYFFNTWIFTISTFLLVCLDQLSHCVSVCSLWRGAWKHGPCLDNSVSFSLFKVCGGLRNW